MGYLSEERETHFYFDPTDGVWKCWTNMRNWKDRLLSRGWDLHKVSRVDGDECDWTLVTDRTDAIMLRDLNKPAPDRSKQAEALRKYRESLATDDKSTDDE